MASTVFPAASAAGKTMFRTTLTSGTSYTVPANVTYLNVTLMGGGGGGGNDNEPNVERSGYSGQVISSTLLATAGDSIAYAIGAGGAGVAVYNTGGNGGTTTFTGATSAAGGNGGATSTFINGTATSSANNFGFGGYKASGNTGSGGAGRIDIEYWA